MREFGLGVVTSAYLVALGYPVYTLEFWGFILVIVLWVLVCSREVPDV